MYFETFCMIFAGFYRKAEMGPFIEMMEGLLQLLQQGQRRLRFAGFFRFFFGALLGFSFGLIFLGLRWNCGGIAQASLRHQFGNAVGGLCAFAHPVFDLIAVQFQTIFNAGL